MENTIYITEDHLGFMACREDVDFVIERLRAYGYNAEYGDFRDNRISEIPQAVWDSCIQEMIDSYR